MISFGITLNQKKNIVDLWCILTNPPIDCVLLIYTLPQHFLKKQLHQKNFFTALQALKNCLSVQDIFPCTDCKIHRTFPFCCCQADTPCLSLLLPLQPRAHCRISLHQQTQEVPHPVQVPPWTQASLPHSHTDLQALNATKVMFHRRRMPSYPKHLFPFHEKPPRSHEVNTQRPPLPPSAYASLYALLKVRRIRLLHQGQDEAFSHP